MGGQAVMAKRLIQNLRSEGLEVSFLPVDPDFPKPLKFAQNKIPANDSLRNFLLGVTG